MTALPRWRSHKVVEAAMICWLDPQAAPIRWVDVMPDQSTGEKIRVDVPANFSARGVPSVGDYLVRYEDGYLSWSPNKAFEEGYARL